MTDFRFLRILDRFPRFSRRWVVAVAILATTFNACTREDHSSAKPVAGNSGVDVAPIRRVEPALAIGPIAEATPHTFSFAPDPGQATQKVNLAGDFNGWSSTALPMTATGDKYQATVRLPAGVHFYKFVVDGQWKTDPASDKDLEVEDSFGGHNSAVLIGPDARTFPAPQPDRINTVAVLFDPATTQDCNVAAPDLLRLSFAAQANDVASATVWFRTNGGAWQSCAMYKLASSHGFDRFGGILTIDPKDAGHETAYILQLSKPGAMLYVGGGKAYNTVEAAQRSPYHTAMKPEFATPEWTHHAVWYQIFPERFRNGDVSNDYDKGMQKWTSAWWTTLPGESGKLYNDIWLRRFGGDIQGIRLQLPYLRELGVTAIYLNPIFQGDDVHKYDTADYRHIDEHFGVKGDIEQLTGETEDPSTWQWTSSDKLFLDFLSDAHRQGFKVILDGVFNHSGKKFWAFQDVLKNGKQSKYADWYDIYNWSPAKWSPFHYRAWDGDSGALPVFRKDNQTGLVHGPREHIMAITRRWLAPDGDASRGVDGFRLDAPENVPKAFWVDWRREVKSIKPDAFIDGEIWDWAQSFLQGDEFDAVMNYRFAVLMQQFFVNQQTALTPGQFAKRCSELVFNYPLQSALAMQNLLDSHDTDRFASMFVNPDRPFDGANRIQDNGPTYSPAKPDEIQRQRILQAVGFQMTFLGSPMIYYGDEAGMWSPDDPSNRQPMIWKDLEPYDDPEVKFDQGKFDWYQRLIAVRQALPALQTGSFRPLAWDDTLGAISFERELNSHRVFVILNRSEAEISVDLALPDEGIAKGYVDWLSPESVEIAAKADAPAARPTASIKAGAKTIRSHDGKVSLTLPAWGISVLTEVPAVVP